MRLFKVSVAAMLVVYPPLIAGLPAEALTANQSMHQGHGRYTNSSGTRVTRPMMRYHRYHRYQRHHRVRSHRYRG